MKERERILRASLVVLVVGVWSVEAGKVTIPREGLRGKVIWVLNNDLLSYEEGLGLLEAEGYTREEVVKELIGLVRERIWGEVTADEAFTRDNAMVMLGKLKAKEALPVLKEVAYAKPMRGAPQGDAIWSIVDILGYGCLDFAREVVTNEAVFSYWERRMLFQKLLNLVEGERGGEVMRFLVWAMGREGYEPSVELLDKGLSERSEEYRYSYEREEILRRWEGAGYERLREQVEKGLKELESVGRRKKRLGVELEFKKGEKGGGG